jgi:ribosomal protein S18 acetylase RimI-like enzyme
MERMEQPEASSMMVDEAGTIRPASLADAADLASMHVASWRETYPGLLPDSMLTSLSVDKRLAMWQQVMGDTPPSGSPKVYIAEIDSKVVGFGSCCNQRTQTLRESGYDGEISAIYVLKAFQRRALGRRLLCAMASDLSGRGFGAVSLWVLRDNAPARHFYERYNAQVVAEREETRPDGVLIEVAYGWKPLAELARLTRAGATAA